jgi:hypothetical protein
MASQSHATTDGNAQSGNQSFAQKYAQQRAKRLREKFENHPSLHNHNVIYSPAMAGVIVVANEIDSWIVEVLENDNDWKVHHSSKGEIAVYTVHRGD